MAARSNDIPKETVTGEVTAPPFARPWQGRLALVLAAVAALEALGILYFGTRGDPRFALELNFVGIGFFGTIVLFAAVGALIVVRRPSTRLAWVMIAMAVLFGAAVVDGAGAVLGSAGTWPLGDGMSGTRIPLGDAGPMRAILVGPGRGGRDHAATDLAALEEVGRLSAEAVRLA